MSILADLLNEVDFALEFSLSPHGAVRHARQRFADDEYAYLMGRNREELALLQKATTVSIGPESIEDSSVDSPTVPLAHIDIPNAFDPAPPTRGARRARSRFYPSDYQTSFAMDGGEVADVIRDAFLSPIPESPVEFGPPHDARPYSIEDAHGGNTRPPTLSPESPGLSPIRIELPCILRKPKGRPQWGLLANPGCHDGEAYKGVYFMPGEAWTDRCVGSDNEHPPRLGPTNVFCTSDGPGPWTGTDCEPTGASTPFVFSAQDFARAQGFPNSAAVSSEIGANYAIFPQDKRFGQWFSEPGAKTFIVDEMVRMGFNIIELECAFPISPSNWKFYSQQRESPCAESDVFREVSKRDDILILPWIWNVASVGGIDAGGHPDVRGVPHFFGNPADPSNSILKWRVWELVERFLVDPESPSWRESWAQMYDSQLRKRFALGLYQFCSSFQLHGTQFRDMLDDIALFIKEQTRGSSAFPDGVDIGFVLDANDWQAQDCNSFPGPVVKALKHGGWSVSNWSRSDIAADSLLAIRNYRTEAGTECLGHSAEMYGQLWEKKFRTAFQWIASGIPYVLDITTGNFAPVVFPGAHDCFYGNDDHWRNIQGSLRGLTVDGRTQIGIAYTGWSAWTEGQIAVPFDFVYLPGSSFQGVDMRSYGDGSPGDTWSRWLTQAMHTDPRSCDFHLFSGGQDTGIHVYGAIGARWANSGGYAGGQFGRPLNSEYDGPVFDAGFGFAQSRRTDFVNGTIFWHPDLGAKGIWWPFIDAYRQQPELGVPIDEGVDCGDGCIIQHFQGGAIKVYL